MRGMRASLSPAEILALSFSPKAANEVTTDFAPKTAHILLLFVLPLNLLQSYSSPKFLSTLTHPMLNLRARHIGAINK